MKARVRGVMQRRGWPVLLDEQVKDEQAREQLPTGWRNGVYTVEELLALGVGEAVLVEAMLIARPHLEVLVPDEAPANEVAAGLFVHGGTRQLAAGFRALVVMSMVPMGPWMPGDRPGERVRSIAPGGPDRPLPGVEVWKGTLVLFGRIWREGSLHPCLTLRATGGDTPSIVLEGLETIRRIGDAQELLGHLRFLQRLSLRGRPPLDAGGDWRARARRSFELKREHPNWSLERIAAELNTSRASLFRWRAKLRAGGEVPNF